VNEQQSQHQHYVQKRGVQREGNKNNSQKNIDRESDEKATAVKSSGETGIKGDGKQPEKNVIHRKEGKSSSNQGLEKPLGTGS